MTQDFRVPLLVGPRAAAGQSLVWDEELNGWTPGPAAVASVFTSQAAALAFEAANPGRVGLWFDSGWSEPTTHQEDFETPAADLYATSVDGLPWQKALMAAFGVSVTTMAAAVSGGVVTHSGVGAGAVIDVGRTNLDVTIDYDLTGGSPTAARQVRIAGRGDPAYTVPAGRPNMPVQVAVRYDGEVRLDPWVDPADSTYKSMLLGTGAPATGTLRVTMLGDKVAVFIGGAQVGPVVTVAGPQLLGTKAGFGVYQGGKVSRFEVTAGG